MSSRERGVGLIAHPKVGLIEIELHKDFVEVVEREMGVWRNPFLNVRNGRKIGERHNQGMGRI